MIPAAFDNFPKVIVPSGLSGTCTPVVANVVLICRPANVLSRGTGTEWPVGTKLFFFHRAGFSVNWEEQQSSGSSFLETACILPNSAY